MCSPRLPNAHFVAYGLTPVARSVVPPGLDRCTPCTQGLRPGLNYAAATRLELERRSIRPGNCTGLQFTGTAAAFSSQSTSRLGFVWLESVWFPVTGVLPRGLRRGESPYVRCVRALSASPCRKLFKIHFMQRFALSRFRIPVYSVWSLALYVCEKRS